MNKTSKTKDSSKPSGGKSLLPVVERMLSQLNQLFVEFVGPIGFELAEDAFQEWLLTGKTGPSGLNRYVAELAKSIERSSERVRFIERSEQILTKLTP